VRTRQPLCPAVPRCICATYRPASLNNKVARRMSRDIWCGVCIQKKRGMMIGYILILNVFLLKKYEKGLFLSYKVIGV